MKQFCAYIHARPSGLPFYIGKAQGLKRPYTMRRNNYHNNIVARHGASNILVGIIDCATEAIALELEIGLIKCFRRMGVRLTNLTDGGEGG